MQKPALINGLLIGLTGLNQLFLHQLSQGLFERSHAFFFRGLDDRRNLVCFFLPDEVGHRMIVQEHFVSGHAAAFAFAAKGLRHNGRQRPRAVTNGTPANRINIRRRFIAIPPRVYAHS